MASSTFQVTDYYSNSKGSALQWNFKLINKKANDMSFYDLEHSSRSLLDLIKDINFQIEKEIKNKRRVPKLEKRTIRKVCQKLLKTLQITLESFSKDIDVDHEQVLSFFKKEQIPEPAEKLILEKCRQWAISVWLSIEPQKFFKTAQQCLDTFSRDGKQLNSDFEQLTELYGVVVGSDNKKLDEKESSQTEDPQLLLIDVNIQHEGKYCSESMLYNPSNISYIKTRSFSEQFVDDFIKLNFPQETPSKEAIQQLEEEVRIQIRSQCLYKSLLKKHAATLLNFSTIEIPSQNKEYLIPIDIKLKDSNGNLHYEDYFEWDILNPRNKVENFCRQLVEDAELEEKYFPQLCYVIRNAINQELEWKFMLLVKTYKPIHKDKESPKLNTQTTQIIKKNLPFAMDLSMVPENTSYTIPNKIPFLNADIFSLFLRNIDILPHEFQQFVSEHHHKKDESKDKIADPLNSKEVIFEKIQKSEIKTENNPYLSGMNMKQCHTAWKRICEEDTQG